MDDAKMTTRAGVEIPDQARCVINLGLAEGAVAQDLARTSTSGSSKSARNHKAKLQPIGLTAREYHVLQILNSYGWCTREMVRLIATLHGISWTERAHRVGILLRRLQEMGFVISRKVGIGTKKMAYAATDRGIRYIRADGDALLCDTNAIKDPAGFYHFLGLNEVMLQFQREFKTTFWLSDFEVRSDNCFIGDKGLAKDYDSVGEVMLPSGSVRFGIEYERSQQSATRYVKLSTMLASEKLLNVVIFLFDDPRLLQVVMSHLKNLAGFAYFVDRSQFLSMGGDAVVQYWNGKTIFQAPLRNVLKHASQKATVPDYTPVHQLNLKLLRYV